MIKEINDIIIKKTNLEKVPSFLLLLDLLAYDMGIIGANEPSCLTKKEQDNILKNFNYDYYKFQEWDLLGEYYQEIQERKELVDLPSRKSLTNMANQELSKYVNTNSKERKILFEPNAGTGRCLIINNEFLSKHGNFFYMACEDNAILYKIALLNICLIHLPAAIINKDSTKIDIKDNSSWKECNEWPK